MITDLLNEKIEAKTNDLFDRVYNPQPQYIKIGDVENFISGKVKIELFDEGFLNQMICNGETAFSTFINKSYYTPLTLESGEPLYPYKIGELIEKYQTIKPKWSETLLQIYNYLCNYCSLFVVNVSFGKANNVVGEGFINNAESVIYAFEKQFNELSTFGQQAREIFVGLKTINKNIRVDMPSPRVPINPLFQNRAMEYYQTHSTDPSQQWYWNTRILCRQNYIDTNYGCNLPYHSSENKYDLDAVKKHYDRLNNKNSTTSNSKADTDNK